MWTGEVQAFLQSQPIGFGVDPQEGTQSVSSHPLFTSLRLQGVRRSMSGHFPATLIITTPGHGCRVILPYRLWDYPGLMERFVSMVFPRSMVLPQHVYSPSDLLLKNKQLNYKVTPHSHTQIIGK